MCVAGKEPGHAIGGITGDLNFVGDVAASRGPIQRLGFDCFHVLGSPLFEPFSRGHRDRARWCGSPFDRSGPGSWPEVVCPRAKGKEGEEGGAGG